MQDLHLLWAKDESSWNWALHGMPCLLPSECALLMGTPHISGDCSMAHHRAGASAPKRATLSVRMLRGVRALHLHPLVVASALQQETFVDPASHGGRVTFMTNTIHTKHGHPMLLTQKATTPHVCGQHQQMQCQNYTNYRSPFEETFWGMARQNATDPVWNTESNKEEFIHSTAPQVAKCTWVRATSNA